MKLFQYTNCKNTVIIENHTCVNCDHFLGYSSYFNTIGFNSFKEPNFNKIMDVIFHF
jgi:hypothetical protein